MQRVVAIVQARMGSSRLPGKVLRPLAGKPIIARVVERLRGAERLDEIAVAIPTAPEDDPLAAVASGLEATVVRGSSQDVLSRYALTIERTRADVVVRVTADCPLLDPATVDRAVASFIDDGVDCVSASHQGGFARGLDAEVVGAATLAELDRGDLDAAAREHVTLALYRPELGYRILHLPAPEELRRPDLRICIDEEADYRMVSAIYDRLDRPGVIIPSADAIKLLSREPTLAAINRGVRQRPPA